MVILTPLPSGKQIYIEKYDRDASADREEADLPIIFIHGLLGTTNAYHPLLSFFPDRTRILFDLEGHGSSPIPSTPLTPASLSRIVSDILAQYGYERSDVVAHSGGSLVALQFANDYPDKLRKLVLMGPPGVPLPKEAMLKNAQLIRSMGAQALTPFMEGGLGSKARSDPAIVNLVKSELSRQPRDTAANVVEALSNFEIGENFEGIEVVVIFGREDKVSDRSACDSLVEALGARMVELETGHFFTAEDPKATGEALKTILDT